MSILSVSNRRQKFTQFMYMKQMTVCVCQVRFVNRKYAIRLPGVNSYDSGLYTCIVTNDYGQLNWTVKLDVIGNDILISYIDYAPS